MQHIDQYLPEFDFKKLGNTNLAYAKIINEAAKSSTKSK